MGYRTKVLQFNSIHLAISNTPRIAYTEDDLAHGILQTPQLGYWFPLRFLVGLCNTLLIVKIYVINHLTFLGYFEKGTATSLHPSSHEQYLFDNVGQNESIQNTPIHVLQYPS